MHALLAAGRIGFVRCAETDIFLVSWYCWNQRLIAPDSGAAEETGLSTQKEKEKKSSFVNIKSDLVIARQRCPCQKEIIIILCCFFQNGFHGQQNLYYLSTKTEVQRVIHR
jgi:hypothetical protein